MDIAFTDLEPEWVSDASDDQRKAVRRDATLTVETAEGVIFLCPRCFEKSGGPVGTHSVLTWFRGRGVPDDRRPGPGRWTVSGSGFSDLTLTPSVDLGDGDWHGFIRNGRAT